MSLNAHSFGPDCKALQDLVYLALMRSDCLCNVKAACIADSLVYGFPVSPSHISDYKAARDNSRRLDQLLMMLICPPQSDCL